MTRSAQADTVSDKDAHTDSSSQSAKSRNRITQALGESRKARHHRDCHCRRFSGQFCNAADALWQNAINRELLNILEENRQ